MDERIERARAVYEQVVFADDSSALPETERELHGVEGDLALARGQLLHTRQLKALRSHPAVDSDPVRELQLFQRALDLYRIAQSRRGEAEAIFWIGIYYQVVEGDHLTATPLFERADELAVEVGDRLLHSYTLRHLGVAAHLAGQLAQARARLEQSTRIRRELGFWPGVVANLIGLTHLAVDQDRLSDAAAHLDEALVLARRYAPGLLEDIGDAEVRLGRR